MKKNIAVIGTGYWGKNLVRNFYEIGALGLVCDADPIAVGRVKEQYEGIQAVSDFNEVLACNDIDGVVVATPAETHFSLAAVALRAGKNVYVEKPLVLDEGEGRQLIALAKEHDRILMVGHLLHYHPAFIKLKELVGAGELGRINYIYSNRLNLGKIRREENILFSFAPHDISMIIALAGELPTKVMATGGRYLHHEIADVTTTHLEFSSGLKAQIFVSWLHPFKEQKLVVVGEEKMAVFDDTLPWEEKLLLYPHKIRWEQGAPVPVKADPERVAVTPAEPLRMECEHFLECIKARKAPYTSGDEGLEVLRVLNAAQRSMDNRGLEETLSGEMDPPKWYAHPTAVIDDGVEIGAKSKVWHFSHISTGAKIGERVNIGQSVLVGPGVHIGEGCKIQNNVSVYQGVTLEADVFCGPSMVFTNVFNPRAHIRRMNELRETLVRQGATLGANCTIICGVKIGRHALVGAGAVVTRDVEDHALVLGNPARRTGWICSCGVKLDEQLLCPACGRCYEQTKTGLRARQE